MSFPAELSKTACAPTPRTSDAVIMISMLHDEIETADKLTEQIMNVSRNLKPIIADLESPCEKEAPYYDEKDTGVFPSIYREIESLRKVNKNNRVVLSHLINTILV